MKRLHIHIKTKDLNASIGFYSAMFGKGPDRLEADYAKWLLDDPAANIAVSSRGEKEGIDHLGISLDTREDLEGIAARLKSDGKALFAEEETTCCYARSNKYWATDPQGAAWELFQTFGDSATFGADVPREPVTAAETSGSCCAPA